MKRFQLAVFSATFSVALGVAFAASTANVHPIVDAQSGYLLGGSKNGKWISDKETAKALKGGEEYSVYSASARAGKTAGSKTRTDEAPCSETQWVTLKKNFNGVVGVSADWNLIPRKARAQNVNQKFYRNEVARILKERGIKKPKVVITQLWRVDLDGDGKEEVLLAASNYVGQKAGSDNISSYSRAGDYSFALLRKVVEGRVQTIMLDYNFYPEAKTFNAPNFFTFAGVYDLNGDGKMEILLNGRYYEGEWRSVIEVKGGQAKEVLSAGCGA